MFSDMLGVIGAIYYAQQHQAAGVVLHLDTEDYVDPNRGSNYWKYFFADSIYLTSHPKVDRQGAVKQADLQGFPV